MFTIGSEYTRDQIHAEVGGGTQTYLPTKGGTVVAVCITKELNPRAPQVILCGRGVRIEPTGAVLAAQRESLPVFIKRGVNRWEFQGQFKVAGSFTSGPRFESFVSGSGRAASDVSRVVQLEAVVHA
jgi:hypothetical protein